MARVARKPREKDRLAETKRQGCAGPKDFWFSGAELDFSTLITLAGNVGPGKVRAATSETA